MNQPTETSNDTTPAIGQSFRRKEDRRFLTGAGRYGDDVSVPGALVAQVVRSPHPHARIERIDSSAGAKIAGVHAIITGADIASSSQRIPSFTRTEPFKALNRDGSLMPEPDQPILAQDKVRYLGEPVALVVADNAYIAQRAADALIIDYVPLAALTEIESATHEHAPRIWDDIPNNQSFDWEHGDEAATDAAFDNAHHVTRLRLRNNRIAAVFMEPRTALAQYHTDTHRITLHTGSQTAHRMQEAICGILKLPTDALDVVTPDLGGGFGARGAVYPEMALVVYAARALKRSVKWVADRSESFLSDTQSRDHVLTGELALDEQGRFTALRVHITWRHGAYLPGRGIWVMTHYLIPTVGGVYTIPHGYIRMRGVVTNTTPLSAIRGVGRVEATYLIESLVDAAARELNIDRIELRRRNLIAAQQLPFTAIGGARYECCTFEPHLDHALQLSDWSGFEQRRPAAQRHLRGIGCAMYVENDGGAPSEYACLTVHEHNRVELAIGTQNLGTGHETVYAQIVMDALSVPFDSVRLVDGDTRDVARGSGSHGSRSMRVGGTAIVMAAEQLLADAKALASEMLQTDAARVRYEQGAFRTHHDGPQVSLFHVAAYSQERGQRLRAEADFTQTRESYSSGCHVCEVAIDQDTGVVTLLQHVIVTDVGRAINPLLVDGQVHGAAVQGLGQAAMEEVRYDPETGQTLTGSLMDYIFPRADDFPCFTTATAENGESDNPLGVKGVGEGPTTGAPAAYMNAVRDALASIGAAPIDMPATSEKIWRAIKESTA